VFSRQVYALARPGDLLIAISGSGNSANVVEAAKTARTQGLKVAAMTGFEGGRLGGLADIHVNVPCNCIAQVEDAHLLIAHAIVEMLKERFGGKSCVKGF
jgi:D-sedoheptulose 7-phosphate isomerase